MKLVPFSDVDRSAMRWLRTGDQPDGFALLSGDQTVLTLEWKERGSSVAVARSSTEEWTLKRGGFLNPHIVVRNRRGDVARLSVHFNYHQIDLVGGRSYRFHRAGVLVPAWAVSSGDRTERLHLEPVREGRRLTGGAVVVPADAVNDPDLLLLTVLSWYFIVLVWFEDEAVETLAPFEGWDAPASRTD